MTDLVQEEPASSDFVQVWRPVGTRKRDQSSPTHLLRCVGNSCASPGFMQVVTSHSRPEQDFATDFVIVAAHKTVARKCTGSRQPETSRPAFRKAVLSVRPVPASKGERRRVETYADRQGSCIESREGCTCEERCIGPSSISNAVYSLASNEDGHY